MKDAVFLCILAMLAVAVNIATLTVAIWALNQKDSLLNVGSALTVVLLVVADVIGFFWIGKFIVKEFADE